MEPRIISRKVDVLSPWTSLVERMVDFGSGPEAYHALRLRDYVNVLAITENGEVVLVRQYRPNLERTTLELPGGLLEAGEDPAQCAVRELAEETGYAITQPIVLLGTLQTDTGRLENRTWCFLARSACPIASHAGEPGVECSAVPLREFRSMVADGRFDHALHVAVVGLAILKNEL